VHRITSVGMASMSKSSSVTLAGGDDSLVDGVGDNSGVEDSDNDERESLRGRLAMSKRGNVFFSTIFLLGRRAVLSMC
jgi:hypothetical protein